MTRALTERRERIVLGGTYLDVLRVGDGPAIMLGHSFLWDAEMWRPQIDALARRFTVIVPELWGHGRSGPLPSDAVDLGDVAQHHLTVLDRLEIETCTVVGLSVGGMWGAEMAIAAPDRVSGLILADTFLGAEPEDRRQMYFAMLDDVQTRGAVSSTILERIVPLFLGARTLSENPALAMAFRARLEAWPADRLLDSVVPLGRMIFGRRDALADLAKLTIPTLVMTGAQDRSRPPEEGRRMAEVLDCPFVEVLDAGHIGSLEQPDKVTQILVGVLADWIDPS